MEFGDFVFWFLVALAILGALGYFGLFEPITSSLQGFIENPTPEGFEGYIVYVIALAIGLILLGFVGKFLLFPSSSKR